MVWVGPSFPRTGFCVNSFGAAFCDGKGYGLGGALRTPPRQRRGPPLALFWFYCPFPPLGGRGGLFTVVLGTVYYNGFNRGQADVTHCPMSIFKIQDSRLITAQRGNTTQTRDPGEHHRPPHNSASCYGLWAHEWPRRLQPHTPVCCKPDRLACCAQSPY